MKKTSGIRVSMIIEKDYGHVIGESSEEHLTQLLRDIRQYCNLTGKSFQKLVAKSRKPYIIPT